MKKIPTLSTIRLTATRAPTRSCFQVSSWRCGMSSPSREQGTGNREQGIGNRRKQLPLPLSSSAEYRVQGAVPCSLLPTPYPLFPVPCPLSPVPYHCIRRGTSPDKDPDFGPSRPGFPRNRAGCREEGESGRRRSRLVAQRWWPLRVRLAQPNRQNWPEKRRPEGVG